MVAPLTAKFSDVIIEVEKDPVASPGVYAKICGLKSKGIDRKLNMDTDEVPADCDDETVPLDVVKSVRSRDINISGSGVWAKQNATFMMKWFTEGKLYSVRVINAISQADVVSGEVYGETGNAYLSALSESVEKGKVVSADITIDFDRPPALITHP